jgi:hypothetical protein
MQLFIHTTPHGPLIYLFSSFLDTGGTKSQHWPTMRFQPLSALLVSVAVLLPFLVVVSAAIFDYNVQQLVRTVIFANDWPARFKSRVDCATMCLFVPLGL